MLAPGVPMRLSLRDGSVVSGRFLGRTLLDSALYRPRFLARSEISSWVPFALGETLLVALRDGRAITEAFTGYGELSLLLANLSGGADLRIPFEFATSIRRADGSHVAPKDLMQAFRKGALPSRANRPFDRSRGCYEGDPPLAAEEWPGGDEAHPAVAGDAADLSRAATSP